MKHSNVMVLFWMTILFVGCVADSVAPVPEDTGVSLVSPGGKVDDDQTMMPAFLCQVDRFPGEDEFFRADTMHCNMAGHGLFDLVAIEVWSGESFVTNMVLEEEGAKAQFFGKHYPLEVRYQAVADRQLLGEHFNLRGSFVVEDEESWQQAQGPSLPFRVWTVEFVNDSDLRLISSQAYEIDSGPSASFDGQDTVELKGQDVLLESQDTLQKVFLEPLGGGPLVLRVQNLENDTLEDLEISKSQVVVLGAGQPAGEPDTEGGETESEDTEVAVVDPCSGACQQDEACVAGQCVRREEQDQDLRSSDSCFSPTRSCDLGEDGDCAEGHGCVEGICRRDVCQNQDLRSSESCFEATLPCETNAHCAEAHACVEGLCRRLVCQNQDLRSSDSCFDATMVCEQDDHCAEGHGCVQGLCRRIVCQNQDLRSSASCFPASQPCEGDRHCSEGHSCQEGLCLRSVCQ